MSAASSDHTRIVADLLRRWPENRIAPSLARIRALTDLLGSPQATAPVIHITGTNGKGSTAIIIDALLRSQGLRTGRYSSPHLVDVTERICIDGHPIAPEVFDATWQQIRPYVELVDERRLDDVPMTFFEVVTGLAFAAFADAPVDVMILEVGMAGTWDATNVADADVAVITPIDLDHTDILGDTVAEIALEKAGIIKPGCQVVLAGQQPAAARVLLERCTEVGALPLREGIDFGVIDRTLAVGGQVLRLTTASGPVGDLHLPLHGVHMAQNAAVAVAAVEALGGGRGLSPEVIQEGFDAVIAPGRTELVRHSPAVVIDSAHNPHAVTATQAAIAESFAFAPQIVVLGMLRGKDAPGVVLALDEETSMFVVTRPDSPRAVEAGDLGDVVAGIVGDDRVVVVPDVVDAIDRAAQLADEAGPGAGVLVVGSVVLAGEVRALLSPDLPMADMGSGAVPDRGQAGDDRTGGASRRGSAGDSLFGDPLSVGRRSGDDDRFGDDPSDSYDDDPSDDDPSDRLDATQETP